MFSCLKFLEVPKFANFTLQDLSGGAKPVEAAQPAPTPSAPSSQSSTPSAPAQTQASQPAPTPSAQSSSNGAVRSTPYARTVSKELGVDINTLKGTGPGGRVIAADVIEGQVTIQPSHLNTFFISFSIVLVISPFNHLN